MFFERKILSKIRPFLATNDIIVITGLRRTGKTTLLKAIYDELSSKNKAFLDLDNIIDQKIWQENDFNNILKNLKAYNIQPEHKIHLFLDEIQSFPDVIKPVKYLYDHYKVKFYLTGSSNFYLKNLFSESLAGRKVIFELYPLDFEEFLVFQQVQKKFYPTFEEKEKNKNKISSEKMKSFVDEYLNYGGFPQVVLAREEVHKKEYLKDIFNSFFEKDVKILSDFRNIQVLRDLIFLLFHRCGSKIDITKLASSLSITRDTVYSYLSFLEQTYFFSFLKPYSKSSDREVSKARKVYACDTGFLNYFSKQTEGCIFENAVYNCLRHFGKIYYYERRNGPEIDFILPELGFAFEVKYQGSENDYQQLIKTSNYLNIKDRYIVTKKFKSSSGLIPFDEL
jgi:predicted AAA+ superfamily ATPase